MIELENVSKIYSNEFVQDVVLKDINAKFEKGKIYGIVGPSGSGKSTLLKIIGGLLKPTTGEVIIDGTHIEKLNEKELADVRLNQVGYIFQDFNLVPFLNVKENILFPLRLSKKNIKDYDIEVANILRSLGIEDKMNFYVHELSGGQQQRVAIARCIIMNPSIILADEPTGNLDKKNTLSFLEVIKDIPNKLNTTVIIVTHDETIEKYCDHILCVEDGQLLL